MRSYSGQVIAAYLAWHGAAFAAEKAAVRWEALARRTDVHCGLKSNGREQVTADISNRSTESIAAEIPPGLVCDLADGTGRIVTLRTVSVIVAAGATGEAIVPAAALSTKNSAEAQTCVATRERLSTLDPLLVWLAERPDVPHATTQLVVLSLVEDIGFSQWQRFLLAARPKVESATHPTPAEVVQAVESLAILNMIATDAPLALKKDAELKLRALRNPLCRARAAALYGLGLPAADGSAVEAPSIGQLLHRVPNDNCPTCRARSGAQRAADGF